MVYWLIILSGIVYGVVSIAVLLPGDIFLEGSVVQDLFPYSAKR